MIKQTLCVVTLALLLNACGSSSDKSTSEENDEIKAALQKHSARKMAAPLIPDDPTTSQTHPAFPIVNPATKPTSSTGVSKSGIVDLGKQGKIEYSDKKVVVSGEKGKNITIDASATAKVPEDFPKDIYLYPGVQVKESVKTDDGFHLMLDTKDPVDKVTAAFKKSMLDLKWQEEAAIESDDGSMLEYSKGDAYSVLVQIMKDDTSTSIMLMVTQEDNNN
jgi:hypothetical protein